MVGLLISYGRKDIVVVEDFSDSFQERDLYYRPDLD